MYRADDENFTTKHLQMRWVPIISKSIDEGRILLYQQTITRTDASIIEAEHYEILMRLQDDKGEIISPAIIIPAAENYNLMHRIDRYVVKHTFKWLAENDAARDRLGLCSINLSGLTLNDANFLGFLESELLRYEIDPEKICFEITETAAISNYQQACSFIHHVKRFGCTFALDDFGSGMSSFSYLKNLAVDFVKIDGSFVRDMVENKINTAIVKSINDVAHIMGKETIGEFVETEEIRAKLLELGVDYVQGYGIHKPEPLDALAGTGRIGGKPVS